MKTPLLILRTCLVLAATFLGCGCGLYKPACRPEALAAIESDYVAEALDACVGYSIDDCPAIPRIEEKYALLREEWAQCR